MATILLLFIDCVSMVIWRIESVAVTFHVGSTAVLVLWDFMDSWICDCISWLLSCVLHRSLNSNWIWGRFNKGQHNFTVLAKLYIGNWVFLLCFVLQLFMFREYVLRIFTDYFA